MVNFSRPEVRVQGHTVRRCGVESQVSIFTNARLVIILLLKTVKVTLTV